MNLQVYLSATIWVLYLYNNKVIVKDTFLMPWKEGNISTTVSFLMNSDHFTCNGQLTILEV